LAKKALQQTDHRDINLQKNIGHGILKNSIRAIGLHGGQ
jgi:hypothetical protein